MVDLLTRGRSILGRTEQEAAVRDYLATGGANLDPATTAWCAAFVNATLRQEGLPVGKDAAQALSSYGDPVLTPRPGDIGVFKRDPIHDPDAPKWQGHAGFFTGQYDEIGNPILLSGNAGDMVQEHPIDANRLIGWRRPPGVQEPAVSESLLPVDARKVAAAIDFSKYAPTQDPARMNPGPYSAVDRVGGTTTPVLNSLFKRVKDNDQFEVDIKNVNNRFITPEVAAELTAFHSINPTGARRMLEKFRMDQNAF